MSPDGLTSWLSNFLEPGWATAGLAIGLVTLTLAYLRSGPVAELNSLTGKSLPEGRPFKSYADDTLQTFLSTKLKGGGSRLVEQPNIRLLYRRALRWDVAFALVFGVLLMFILDGTLGVAIAKPSAYWWLLFIPAGAGAVDIAEDLLLLRATRDEKVDPAWTRFASVVTWLKWGLVALSLVLAVWGALALGITGANS